MNGESVPIWRSDIGDLTVRRILLAHVGWVLVRDIRPLVGDEDRWTATIFRGNNVPRTLIGRMSAILAVECEE